MDHTKLAQVLLAARDKRQRLRLITANAASIGPDVARQLKNICVESWAAAPKLTRKASRVLDEIVDQAPSREVSAYAHWAGGIAEMTFGRLEEAIRRLDQAAADFATARLEYESAQPQIAILVALAMLGRHERIPSVGKRALRIFQKYGDDLSAGKVEINLSNIASRQGHHRRAERLGRSAYDRFKKIQARSWQAMAENGLAITYTELNEFRRAEKFFRAALRSARSTGAKVTEAETLASIGNLELFRGRYAKALHSLELSRQKFDEIRMPHKSAVADLEIAEIYSELNLTREASELFNSVVEKLSRLKMPNEEARARLGLGRLMVRLRGQAAARRHFQKALSFYGSENNRPGEAAVILNLAFLERSIGRFSAAVKFAAQAEKVFRRIGSDRQRLMSSWIRYDAGARSGQRRKGLTKLGLTLAEALKLEQTPVALLALNSVGDLELAAGNVPAAKAAFQRAIRITERSRAPLTGEEFRIAFLDGRLEPYERLARIGISEGKLAEALRNVERAKARTLLEGVHEEAGREISPHVAQLREKLNWSHNRLRDPSVTDPTRLQNEIRRLEKHLSDALRRTESFARDRRLGRGDSVQTFVLANLQNELGPQRALIEYVEFEGKISAFVVTDSTISFRADLATAASIIASIEDLRFQFGSLRYGRAHVAAFLTQLRRRTDLTLEQLHKKLLGPLEVEIGNKDLLIVQAGPTHYVPFAALRSGSRYVIESRAISTAPSALVWQALKRRDVTHAGEALLMAYADEAAPMVEREVQAISKMLKSSVVFAGEAATFANFERNAANRWLIHLACHGQFRADNPFYSNLRIADGNITVRDLSAKRLRGARVVLSACETGLNGVFPGEEIVGLARGFINAGVRSLALSLWTVNDEATKRLMTTFYVNLQRGESTESSLRLAQMKFIEEGEHPYYWSPFFTIG